MTAQRRADDGWMTSDSACAVQPDEQACTPQLRLTRDAHSATAASGNEEVRTFHTVLPGRTMVQQHD